MAKAKQDDPVLTFRIPPPLQQALEAYRSSLGDDVTRSEAVRRILADWLRTHGFSKSDLRPIGPATDAVDAMDAAITKDRAGRAPSKRLASVKETGEEVPQEVWERFEAAGEKPGKR